MNQGEKFLEALDFLNNHPGINTGANWSFFHNHNLIFYSVCKNGEPEGSVPIYYGDKLAKRYPKEFEKLIKENNKVNHNYKTPDKFLRLYKDYEEVYGEKWKFHKVKYGCDVVFYVFAKNPNKTDNRNSEWNDRNWARYHGFTIYGKNFDDSIIKSAERVKEIYGDFSYDDFYTDEEKANNKKYEFCSFKELKGDKKGLLEMVKNDKYMNVNYATLNLRWLKWFITTDYCKEHWSQYSSKDFNKAIKMLDKK